VHDDTCVPKWIVACNWGWNVAVTAESAFVATVHAAVPEQAPLHLVNLKLAFWRGTPGDTCSDRKGSSNSWCRS
jgi:hypothetical protein